MPRNSADLLIVGASEVLTLGGASHRPRTGAEMNELGIIKDGVVAIKGGLICDIGSLQKIYDKWSAPGIIHAEGRVVMPGFVDCHTHAVFAGSREIDFIKKIVRKSGREISAVPAYLEILKGGGGILETVAKTREASEERLMIYAAFWLNNMLKYGTTTVEIKSGYGLSFEDELKILFAIKKLRGSKMDIVSTFLGAHAFPPEKSREAYLKEIIDHMIPHIYVHELAKYCDVFCEAGAFSVEEAEKIIEIARVWGLKIKLHAGEFNDLGAVELGVKYGAVSIDHLDHISDSAILAMAEAETIGVLLPAVPFHLMTGHYAPARKMIDAGVPIALATDFNPGSAPTFSMQMVIALACRQMQMTPAEAITASTINAAHAIGMEEKVGSLEIGKQADIIILDIDNYLQLPYWFGGNLAREVIKKGVIVS